MALLVNCSTHLIQAYYLQLTYYIYRPRKDERLSWPSWLTCSGRFTHISGHPSAAGRAQDSESSPVRDRRSTTVPRAGKNIEIASSAGYNTIQYNIRLLEAVRTQRRTIIEREKYVENENVKMVHNE